MKKIFFLFAITISIYSFGQLSISPYDTLISISNSPITGLARKAAPVSYLWQLSDRYMIVSVDILTYSGDSVINNLQIHNYNVHINTDGICVNPSTGEEVPCSTVGSISQYVLLRSLSLKPVSIMYEILQYIQMADKNGTFN